MRGLLDSEIAAATGIPLPKVRVALSDLLARGEIARCSVARFSDGKPFEATLLPGLGLHPAAGAGQEAEQIAR